MNDASWNTLRGGFLGYLLSQTRNAAFNDLAVELEPMGITCAQFRVVAGIAHKRANTLSDFARYLDYDTGAMKRLLDRVEEKGLIRRVPCPADRRTLNLELTDEGQALYPQLMAAVKKVHERMLQGFSPQEEEQLQNLLQRITANTLHG
ncbi:MarR family winged helix-turn-helix transcriptional regulator [Pseudoduganella sp. OTU4001]|uniref:MarR family winged helix-turn-helix transcriptional regulator n=1 Tax=Pseudoduganella sp. OTU4001 TaxID=3043854 RepID=UPI00313C865E